MERSGETCVGRREQILGLADSDQAEGRILIEGVEHLLKPHGDRHDALNPGLDLHQRLVLGGKGTHYAGCHSEGARQTVHAVHHTLQPGIIMGQDICLRSQVTYRI